MEHVILCGEKAGFWNVAPNDILLLQYNQDHNYELSTKSGIVVVKNICCNDKKEILDQYLRNGDHFTVREVRGNAVKATMNACKKVDSTTIWDA